MGNRKDSILQAEAFDRRVSARGNAICDEWAKKRLPSREVAVLAERAVSVAAQLRGREAYAEALAYLLALEKRIQTAYQSPWRHVFLYPLRRREQRLLARLLAALPMPDAEENKPLRREMTVALQSLRERIRAEEFSDRDTEASGGKRSEKNEELQTDSEKTQEETVTEPSDARVDPEKNVKSATETGDTYPQDAQTERSESRPSERNTPVTPVTPVKEEKINQTVERSDAGNVPESGKRQGNEAKADEGYVDPLSLDREAVTKTPPSESSRWVDDLIAREREDAIIPQIPREGDRALEGDRAEAAEGLQEAARERFDLNAYLDDELAMLGRNADGRAMDARSKPQPDATRTQDATDTRIPLQVDITVDQENEMRRAINDTLSADAVRAIYERQAAAMREQLSIASEELGIDAPVEIIGSREASQIGRSESIHNRK